MRMSAIARRPRLANVRTNASRDSRWKTLARFRRRWIGHRSLRSNPTRQWPRPRRHRSKLSLDAPAGPPRRSLGKLSQLQGPDQTPQHSLDRSASGRLPTAAEGLQWRWVLGAACSRRMSLLATPALESCTSNASTISVNCGTSPATASVTRSPGTTCAAIGGPSGGLAIAAAMHWLAAAPVTPAGPRQSATSADGEISRTSGSWAPYFNSMQFNGCRPEEKCCLLFLPVPRILGMLWSLRPRLGHDANHATCVCPRFSRALPDCGSLPSEGFSTGGENRERCARFGQSTGQ